MYLGVGAGQDCSLFHLLRKACMLPLVPQKLVPRKSAFRAALTQKPLGSASKLCGVCSTKDLSYTFRGTARGNSNHLMFSESLGFPEQQLRRGCPMSCGFGYKNTQPLPSGFGDANLGLLTYRASALPLSCPSHSNHF